VGAWQGTPEAKPRNGLRRVKAGGEQWDNPPAREEKEVRMPEQSGEQVVVEWEERLAAEMRALLALGYGTLRVEVAEGKVRFIYVEHKIKVNEKRGE
jgi:hypothetical protein